MPGLFKANGSLLDDPLKLIEAQIDTMMQQLKPTWNSHQKLEFFKICVRTTLAGMGQIASSLEKRALIMLETALGNLCNWKEEIVMAAPVQAVNGMKLT